VLNGNAVTAQQEAAYHADLWFLLAHDVPEQRTRHVLSSVSLFRNNKTAPLACLAAQLLILQLNDSHIQAASPASVQQQLATVASSLTRIIANWWILENWHTKQRVNTPASSCFVFERNDYLRPHPVVAISVIIPEYWQFR
jgi:hypothetical protein